MNLTEYVPRRAFLNLHNRTARWATVVAHRRAGKTVAMCADIVIGALECAHPRPQFAYLAPFREQAKKVAWSYLKDLTKELQTKEPNESELKIVMRAHTGQEATIYVAGADNPDSLRGLYFDGVVLDEVGDMRPSAWYSVLRPALSDRQGWAIFAGTPRGKNLFWNLREEARLNPRTHILLELPASKTGILPDEELRDAKAQMTAESYEIEYECSFDAAIPGAFWAKDIGRAYEEGRVGDFKIDREFPVHYVADLGYTDSCSWWGWQETPDGLKIVEFYEKDNEPISHYIQFLKSKAHKVGQVWLPHDAKAKSLQTGRSIMEQFLQAGITPRLVPDMSLMDGIEAARQILPHCWFDESPTYQGLEHLRGYMREWDDRTQTFRNRPKHDQHSHCFVAGTMVSTPSGPRPIESIKVGDEVRTPGGIQKVDATMSSVVDELLELYFDNGSVIRCTKDHPFVTRDGIVLADALRYSHLIEMEPSCESTPFLNSTASSFIGNPAGISKRTMFDLARATCTAMFGSITTGRSLKGTTFITKTETRPTTASKIWSACRSAIIFRITREKNAPTSLGGGTKVWSLQEKLQRRGTAAMKDAAGTAKTVLVPGLAGSYAIICAPTAARLIPHSSARSKKARDFVLTPAKRTLAGILAWTTKRASAAFAAPTLPATSTSSARPAARLVQMRRLQERTRVYDLTVRHEHVFYANGLLVGNCADAFRYLALCARTVVKNPQRRDKIDGGQVRSLHSFSLNDLWDTAPQPSRRIA